MDCNDVAIIVSRWFGGNANTNTNTNTNPHKMIGTLLGPDRFKIILTVARQLLDDNDYGNSNKKKNNKLTHGGSRHY